MVWVWITCGMVFKLSLFHTILFSSLLCLDVVCWVTGEFECWLSISYSSDLVWGWYDFILTTLRLGNHTFVLLFRFFFLLFPSTNPLSTWITREMAFDLESFLFCLLFFLFFIFNYNLYLFLVLWSFFFSVLFTLHPWVFASHKRKKPTETYLFVRKDWPSLHNGRDHKKR